jgi:DNA-binding transcriptional regulator YdaS (Cro superfamily)
MDLKEYLSKLDDPAEFAERCDTSIGQLRHVAHGRRRSGEALAINIERESGGAIRCEDLRPDVDWGYLRSTKSTAA